MWHNGEKKGRKSGGSSGVRKDNVLAILTIRGDGHSDYRGRDRVN